MADKTEAMEHVIHSSMPIDFERRYAMDNLIAQDADLIDAQPTQSDAVREENERLRALLARTVNLAEVYAEGTGTNFKEAMAEARAALQEQSK
jgi:hypothetical protein